VRRTCNQHQIVKAIAGFSLMRSDTGVMPPKIQPSSLHHKNLAKLQKQATYGLLRPVPCTLTIEKEPQNYPHEFQKSHNLLPNRPGSFPSVECSWVEGMSVTVHFNGSDQAASPNQLSWRASMRIRRESIAARVLESLGLWSHRSM
jgi:hypothetical protein